VDPFGLLIVAGIGVAGAASYAVHVWRDDARRTRRVLRKTRVTPISELVDGQLACIVGRVERDRETITSLMENRPCVAFDTITHVIEQDKDFTAPVVTKATRHMVPFFVVDKTGRARIDAPQAALCNKPSSRKPQWVERIVEEGATVRLVGSVVLDPTERDHRERGFRDASWKATITGTVKFPLLIDTE
jgi:hypothetical protein